nr:unnamed protein product [Callosobruchus analis]
MIQVCIDYEQNRTHVGRVPNSAFMEGRYGMRAREKYFVTALEVDELRDYDRGEEMKQEKRNYKTEPTTHLQKKTLNSYIATAAFWLQEVMIESGFFHDSSRIEKRLTSLQVLYSIQWNSMATEEIVDYDYRRSLRITKYKKERSAQSFTFVLRYWSLDLPFNDVARLITIAIVVFLKVTPTTTKAVTYDEESWKPSSEETVSDKKDLSRTSEARQSKTKRVKNYLKKCKSVLGSSKSNSLDIPESSQTSRHTSWYLQNVNECEVNELEDIFEEAQVCLNLSECSSSYQVANVIEVRGPPNEADGGSCQSSANYSRQESDESKLENKCDEQTSQSNVCEAACFEEDKKEESEVASPTLSESQGRIDGENEDVGACSLNAKATNAPEKAILQAENVFSGHLNTRRHRRKDISVFCDTSWKRGRKPRLKV